MGEMAQKIVKMDVDELIELLNKALADEWLAYFQYWAGANVIKGPMRPQVEEELKEHADEELKHANMLAERIIQLGGTPIITPDFEKLANCKYDAPEDPHVMKLLDQNIEAERCAIGVYNTILSKLKGSDDAVTYNTIRKIMQDEIEHEQELEDLKEDIGML